MSISRGSWEKIADFENNKGLIRDPITVYLNPSSECLIRLLSFEKHTNGLFSIIAVFPQGLSVWTGAIITDEKLQETVKNLHSTISNLSKTEISNIQKSFREASFPQANWGGIQAFDLNEDRTVQFLELVREKEEINQTSLEEILESIGLRLPEKYFQNEISSLMEDGKIDEAWCKAIELQKNNYFEIIWEVVENFNIGHSHDEVDRLINMYENIAHNNPKYADTAVERLITLTGEKYPNKDDKIIRLEKQITLAMRMKEKNTDLISRLFSELCNLNLDNNINIFSASGLIELARLMRLLNESSLKNDDPSNKLKLFK